MKSFYRRNLPHILPPGEIIFCTFRLASSLPAEAVFRLQQEQDTLAAQIRRQYAHDTAALEAVLYQQQKAAFGRMDAVLDAVRYGPAWLRETFVAQAVTAEIRRLDEADCVVISYCIMPNHVHLVVQLPPTMPQPFAKLMQALKGRSARQANLLLQRSGPFWQHESYDHIVRHAAELERIIAYVLNNPVKAGLCSSWKEWPHSYWRP
ncbi:hypothetical protein EJV47_11890 [Hymenobacter gummosus]|uniref:Transposase IS200-like domain-containing protein n=1 Tax=Hymenobacter gummosus TaxID=1776032 RepID=A0A3S0QHT3_9BACT|nr:transposase [Hymenobacter gummosus]RTQ49522.1 hypothetical protein EJV47_11890 [Hymenobacter gummosus]